MNFSALDSFLRDMPQRGIPACELVVAKDHRILYRATAGHSDTEGHRKVSENDLYWIFSVSKLFTCVAAMRLVEEGKLALSDPVSKYIPAYRDITVKTKDGSIRPAETEMTVLHLFTMTGGMNYSLRSPALTEAIAKPDVNTLTVAEALARTPLDFDPGRHYQYSLCHDVLAAVVEVVCGRRFSDYVTELILKPLGMTETGFRPTEEQKSRFSAMYRYDNGTGIPVPMECQNQYALFPEYDSGGAGLFSRTDDVIRLLDTVASGGSTKDGYVLLKPETIAMMQQNHLSDICLNDFVKHRFFGYGFGLCCRVHTDPCRSLSRSPVGEIGWDGAAGAYAMMDPKNKISIYYAQHLLNCSIAYYKLHDMIRNTVYDALHLDEIT